MQAGEGGWQDLGSITVPSGTKRRTLIDRTLEDYADQLVIEPGEKTALRIVPREYATSIPVTLERPEPKLRVAS
jgi:hypothetical protein